MDEYRRLRISEVAEGRTGLWRRGDMDYESVNCILAYLSNDTRLARLSLLVVFCQHVYFLDLERLKRDHESGKTDTRQMLEIQCIRAGEQDTRMLSNLCCNFYDVFRSTARSGSRHISM